MKTFTAPCIFVFIRVDSDHLTCCRAEIFPQRVWNQRPRVFSVVIIVIKMELLTVSSYLKSGPVIVTDKITL